MESEKEKLNDTNESEFTFTSENFRSPNLKKVKNIVELPVINVVDNKDLAGYGYLVDDVNNFTFESGNFEIVKWPTSGWRKLDPDTGDEAGTTEGDFEVIIGCIKACCLGAPYSNMLNSFRMNNQQILLSCRSIGKVTSITGKIML